MNEDTIKLLEECNAGCKMAIGSMNQVQEYVQDDELRQAIDKYKARHEKLEEESAGILEESGKQEKEPGVVASTFSWFTTEMKLMIDADNHQIAKLMMDGCNMGIQSISEFQNQYSEASKEAKEIAKKLIQMEEEFRKEVEKFL